MPGGVLVGLIGILQAITQLTATIAATQTPDQQKLAWDRWFTATEWIWKLLAKVSDDIEKLIQKETTNG